MVKSIYARLISRDMPKKEAFLFMKGISFAKKLLNDKDDIVNLEKVLFVVSKITDVKILSIRSKLQTRKVVEARYVYYLASNTLFPKIPYSTIGLLVGKNHSNVMAGMEAIENLMENDKKIKKFVEEIISELEKDNRRGA